MQHTEEKSLGRRLARLCITAAQVRLATCAMALLSLNSEDEEVPSWVASLLGLESGSSTEVVLLQSGNSIGAEVVIPCKVCHERSTSLALPYRGCECTTAKPGQESSSGDVCSNCGDPECGGPVYEQVLAFTTYASMLYVFNFFVADEVLTKDPNDYWIYTGTSLTEEEGFIYVVRMIYKAHLDPEVTRVIEALGL